MAEPDTSANLIGDPEASQTTTKNRQNSAKSLFGTAGVERWNQAALLNVDISTFTPKHIIRPRLAQNLASKVLG
jgi:hypothetical protein